MAGLQPSNDISNLRKQPEKRKRNRAIIGVFVLLLVAIFVIQMLKIYCHYLCQPKEKRLSVFLTWPSLYPVVVTIFLLVSPRREEWQSTPGDAADCRQRWGLGQPLCRCVGQIWWLGKREKENNKSIANGRKKLRRTESKTRKTKDKHATKLNRTHLEYQKVETDTVPARNSSFL